MLSNEKIAKIINEELSIADEVDRISSDIYNEIVYKSANEYSNNKGKPSSYFSFKYNEDITVFAKIFFFSTQEDEEAFITYPANVKKIINSYSFEKKELTLFIPMINGKINHSELADSIQHEIEHYYQIMKSKKNIWNIRYQRSIEGISSKIVYISIMSRIYYITRKFELDAYLNGSYSSEKRIFLPNTTYNDFINSTSLNDIFLLLKQLMKLINSWNWKSNSVQYYSEQMNGIYGWNKNIDKKNFLLKLLNKAYSYLQKKSAKIYSKLLKENEYKLSENAFISNNIDRKINEIGRINAFKKIRRPFL